MCVYVCLFLLYIYKLFAFDMQKEMANTHADFVNMKQGISGQLRGLLGGSGPLDHWDVDQRT